MLCSWPRHVTLISVKFDAWANPAMDYDPIEGGVEILLSLHAAATGINSGLMDHLTRMQS